MPELTHMQLDEAFKIAQSVEKELGHLTDQVAELVSVQERTAAALENIDNHLVELISLNTERTLVP